MSESAEYLKQQIKFVQSSLNQALADLEDDERRVADLKEDKRKLVERLESIEPNQNK